MSSFTNKETIPEPFINTKMCPTLNYSIVNTAIADLNQFFLKSNLTLDPIFPVGTTDYTH